MNVDVLLIENLIINYFILNVTSRFSKIKTTKVKLFVSSIVGALYIIVIFLPALKIFFSLSMKIAVSVLMIIIAFTPDRFKEFFKVLGIFYVVSFAFGGAAFSLFYFTGRGSVLNGVFYIKDFPVSLLVTAFAVGYLLLVFCWDHIQTKMLNDKLTYNIIIEFNGEKVQINAMLDTGNSLKDPISSFPVIVVEYDALRGILPGKLSCVFEDNKHDVNLEQLCGLLDNTNWIYRIRLIPFSSLGKQNGILVGIKPDKVNIKYKSLNKEVKNVIIGVCNNKISKDGEFKALLYPEILK